METDRTEMNDLVGQYPELVKSLSKEWQQWADKSMVEPWEKVLTGNY